MPSGVWFNSGDDLVLFESFVDEIPNFVHRTQNPREELLKRMNRITMIGKPIIHLTTDKPLGVDIGVGISLGQPWYAYPKPNDFFLEVNGEADMFDDVNRKEESLTLENAQPFEDNNPGYPWVGDQNRTFGSSAGPMGNHNRCSAIGLDWHGLSVTPTQGKVQLPKIKDQKYQWWNRLREVGSSFIESRGEAERFIFYDGPTLFPAFHKAKIVDDKIHFSVSRRKHDWGYSNTPIYALLINVSSNGQLSGEWIVREFSTRPDESLGTPITRYQRVVGFEKQFTIAADSGSLSGDKVQDAFRYLVQVEGGLTNAETEGMMEVWAKEFFEKPGKRILFRMSRENYDLMCPLNVRPVPTEISRVGIVLSELKE